MVGTEPVLGTGWRESVGVMSRVGIPGERRSEHGGQCDYRGQYQRRPGGGSTQKVPPHAPGVCVHCRFALGASGRGEHSESGHDVIAPRGWLFGRLVRCRSRGTMTELSASTTRLVST